MTEDEKLDLLLEGLDQLMRRMDALEARRQRDEGRTDWDRINWGSGGPPPRYLQ